jgi:glycosyltransferase involved in cell wall biosynthesis
MRKDFSVSLVVPCYQSEKGIRDLVMACLKQAAGFSSFELILVDDGSRDATWKEIVRASGASAQVKGFRLLRNYGEHAALVAGLKQCRGDFLFTLDDDLQHDPADLPKLAKALLGGADLVYGQYTRNRHTLFRRLLSLWNGWLATLLHRRPLGVHLSSFRGMSRELWEKTLQHERALGYIDAALLRRAEDIQTVPISHSSSPNSRYSLLKLAILHLKALGLSGSSEAWVRDSV